MLEPRAVAVVGVSREKTGIGRRILDAVRKARFAGPVYAVNPRKPDLGDEPCYATVTEAPAGVDLAIIAVPRDHVLNVVHDCAAAGVKSLVVITAGFAEAGEEGRALQKQLVETVRSYGMRLVGPNCMGLLNAGPDISLNASFSWVFPPAGHIALSSQSGALGITILDLAAERKLGISSFVSVGNKADVSGNDLLQYWEGDPATSVILLYLESFGNPRRFARLAQRIGRKKPIVVVKAGRTQGGRRAAGSHTAALLLDGSVRCWGRAVEGQCAVPGGLGAANSVAAGGFHTAALRADGSIVAWGSNTFGQCAVPATVGACSAIAAMW